MLMNFWPTVVLICLQFSTCCAPQSVISRYPFVVVIEIGGKSGHLCSGSLLDLRWVLTSAKMVYKYKKNPDSLIVTRSNQTRIVEQIFHHPAFNPDTLEHDLALIFLKHPFDKTDYVDPSRIPSFPMDVEMVIKSEEVELTRFQGASTKISRYRVLANKECAGKVSFNLLKKISFCAEPLHKNDCFNNTGAPAVLDGFVFGVSSFGCSPEVFTRVDKHLRFISKTMNPSFLLRSPEHEEIMERSRTDFIIAVSLSILVLIIVLVILVWTFCIPDKHKCWKKLKF